MGFVIFLFFYIYKSESMFVAMFLCIFVCMYTVNSLTPKPIPTKFGVLTNQNRTKEVGYKSILILASIGVFPLIKVAPINPHMHRLLLGRGDVFFGVRFFWGTLLWQQPNKGLMGSFVGSVATQRPVSNNREVFSLGSVLKLRPQRYAMFATPRGHTESYVLYETAQS
jgi:hypothetical protein